LLNDYLKEQEDSSRRHHKHGHGAWSDFQEVKEDLPRGKRLFRSTAPNYSDHSGEDEVQSIGESDVELLQSHGITAIISLNEYSYNDDSLELLKEHKISYLHRSVVGHHSPTRDDFNVAKKLFLLQPATLIHCGDGKGRTGTLITAIQLFASKGVEPPEVDWARVNHVQSDEQVSQLRALREVVQVCVPSCPTPAAILNVLSRNCPSMPN
jgi:protein tyrosine phosphatase